MIVRILTLLPVLLITLAAPLQAQRGGPAVPDIETYLKQIKASHNRLFAAGQEFGLTMLADIDGKDAGHAKVNAQFRKAVKTLGVTLKETRAFKAPNDDAARELQKVNDEFLDVQGDLTCIMLSDLVEVVLDDALTADEKRSKVNEIIQEGSAREQEIGAKVNTAWNRLAAEYEIEIDE